MASQDSSKKDIYPDFAIQSSEQGKPSVLPNDKSSQFTTIISVILRKSTML